MSARRRPLSYTLPQTISNTFATAFATATSGHIQWWDDALKPAAEPPPPACHPIIDELWPDAGQSNLLTHDDLTSVYTPRAFIQNIVTQIDPMDTPFLDIYNAKVRKP